MQEALAAADFAFAPNAALAPRQHQAGIKAEVIEIPDDTDEQIAKTPAPAVQVKQEQMKNEEVEITIKHEVQGDDESYGRYDTYAPSAAGARLVSRGASPATAASLVAVTPVHFFFFSAYDCVASVLSAFYLVFRRCSIKYAGF
jgi:hypothetical protein